MEIQEAFENAIERRRLKHALNCWRVAFWVLLLLVLIAVPISLRG